MARTLLVLLCLALVLLALLGMRRGWHRRGMRQAGLPPLPVPPADLGTPLMSVSGLYVGSAFAGSWQDRVVHAGLGERAEAVATLYDAGVIVDRTGTEALFVPIDTVDEARLAPALAGKVMGAGGLLVVRWRLGDALIDTGLRADDKTVYPAWVDAINGKVTA